MTDEATTEPTWWELLAELTAALEAFKAAPDQDGRDRAEERHRRATQALMDYGRRHAIDE